MNKLIVLVALLALVLAAIELVNSQPKTEPTCMDAATAEKVKAAMHDALDAALQSQIESSFHVWMRDNAGQPDRARRGIGQAIRAYVQARGNTQAWVPPLC
jgi:hypothetical protein